VGSRLAAVVLLSLAACVEPASQFDDALGSRVEGPPSEFDLRSGSVDLFEFATAHWRFYDDYLDLQPAACADEADGGAEWPYLWRHGAETFDFSLANGRSYGYRAGLDVSSAGLVVLQTNDRLWTFAADGGAPLHADRGTRMGGGPLMAAFATETLLWTDGDGAPALFDLSQPRDRSSGWKVSFSWREQHAQQGGLDYWFQPSPAVQRDGTLIWTSAAGLTRALKITGEVKWEVPAAEGPLLVTTDDVVLRALRGDFVAFKDDGGVRWRDLAPPNTTVISGTLVDEGRYPTTFVPMAYSTASGISLITRRARDGAELSRFDTADGGRIGGLEVVGTDGDGWLFINARESAAEVFTLSSRAPDLSERWRVPSRALEFAPIASASGDRLVTIDKQCRVNLIDRQTGATLASHRMVGRPGRFLPRYFNGVLYVVAEIRPGVTVNPSQMQGRSRPDGGLIDVADYGCYAAPFLDGIACPAVEADDRRRVYALYAFQVD
jgi:hypothetical protein